MAIYKKFTGTQGPWLNAAEVKSGISAKLIAETEPQEGQFGKRDVSKIRLEGDPKPYNVNLNRTTINGLVEAFGENSRNWIDKPLTVHTEKMTVSGRRTTVLYILPQGFELVEDTNGYLVITRAGAEKEDIPIIESQTHGFGTPPGEDEINNRFSAVAEEDRE